MGTWADLTPEQQGIAGSWMRNVRAAAGVLSRNLTDMDELKVAYTSEVAAIFALLDADADIEDGSGLQDAQLLNKTELNPMILALNSLVTDYYTDDMRALYQALAGINAVLE